MQLWDMAVWKWDLKGEAFGGGAPNDDVDMDGEATGLKLRFPGQVADVVGEIAINHYRNYEASVGRYIEADLIGLLGGSSNYSYVGGNPLSYIDPHGLVRWRGYAHGGGFGIFKALGYQRMNLHLTSDCALGEMVTVDVDVSFLSGGAGVPASYTISNIELEDGHAGAYPESLIGSAYFGGFSGAIGGGVAYQTLTVGDGFSDFSWGAQGG